MNPAIKVFVPFSNGCNLQPLIAGYAELTIQIGSVWTKKSKPDEGREFEVTGSYHDKSMNPTLPWNYGYDVFLRAVVPREGDEPWVGFSLSSFLSQFRLVRERTEEDEWEVSTGPEGS